MENGSHQKYVCLVCMVSSRSSHRSIHGRKLPVGVQGLCVVVGRVSRVWRMSGKAGRGVTWVGGSEGEIITFLRVGTFWGKGVSGSFLYGILSKFSCQTSSFKVSCSEDFHNSLRSAVICMFCLDLGWSTDGDQGFKSPCNTWVSPESTLLKSITIGTSSAFTMKLMSWSLMTHHVHRLLLRSLI